MTEISIPTGVLCREEYHVGEEHAAKHVGSGDVEVLSTPSMILFMEMTALKCIEKYLPPRYTTVGTAVNVKHMNPAPVNDNIVIEARIASVEGRKIVFEVRALWRDLIIGEGTHERYVVDRERFLNKVRNLVTSSKYSK